MNQINAVCVEFCKNYGGVNTTFKKNKPKEYDIAMIAIHLEELDNGFIVKRINKTNSKGTKVVYRAVQNNEELDDYINFLKKLVEEFNKRWGENIELGLS